MKNINRLIIAAICLLSPGFIKAQMPSVGFEEWKTQSFGLFSVTNPKGWTSSNLMQAYMGDKNPATVVKSNDKHTGSYAALVRPTADSAGVKQPGFLSTGTIDFIKGEFNDKFKISGKPVKLEGYYKYQSSTNDGFSVGLILYKDGEVVGSATLIDSTNKTAYTKFSVDVMYDTQVMPDSANVSIFVGSNESQAIDATLIIDDISILYETTSVNEQLPEAAVKVFPNPATSIVYIESQNQAAGALSFEITDAAGKTLAIAQQQIQGAGDGQSLAVGTDGIAPGLYFVRVMQGEKTKTIKLIIQ